MRVYLKDTVLLFICTTTVYGLGINCRGSGLCPLATFENVADVSVLQGLRDAIYLTTFPDDTTYNSGDHVICVSTSLQVTIGVGEIVSLSASGSIGTGGICVFPQDLAEPITLAEIKPLADALLSHGCTTCGSVPVHFVDQGSNDPSQGILTWNYVGDPVCINSCISAADQATGGDSSSAQVTTIIVTQTQAPQAQTSTYEPATEQATTEQASTEPAETTVYATQSYEPATTTVDAGGPATVTVTAPASSPAAAQNEGKGLMSILDTSLGYMCLVTLLCCLLFTS